MAFKVPATLAANCGDIAERVAWLTALPGLLGDLERRWSLKIGAPFDNEEVNCAWVDARHTRGWKERCIESLYAAFRGRA